jgi:excisionase family DNA binding protein
MSGVNATPKLYRLDQAAKILNISKATAYRLIEERKIPFYKIRGSVRVAEKDILEYLEQNRVEPVE